MIEFNDRLS